MSEEFNNDTVANLVNNSGQGAGTPVVSLVSKHFNWGAFGFSWIWGLFNKTYLPLIVIPVSFIPLIGSLVSFGLMIWFGVKGNTWSWQNKKWESIEQFHKHQKNWAIAYCIIMPFSFVLGFLSALFIPTLVSDNASEYKQQAWIKKEVFTIVEVTTQIQALDEKVDFSTKGLTDAYKARLFCDDEKSHDNVLYLKDGSVWEFTGDGQCVKEAACYVSISAPNLEGFKLNLYAKENNVSIKKEDVESILSD